MPLTVHFSVHARFNCSPASKLPPPGSFLLLTPRGSSGHRLFISAFMVSQFLSLPFSSQPLAAHQATDCSFQCSCVAHPFYSLPLYPPFLMMGCSRLIQMWLSRKNLIAICCPLCHCYFSYFMHAD